jgi:hypothetical protein
MRRVLWLSSNPGSRHGCPAQSNSRPAGKHPAMARPASSTAANTAGTHSETFRANPRIRTIIAAAKTRFCVICVICGYFQDFRKSVAKRNKTMPLKKNREKIPFDKKPQKRLIFAKRFGSKKNPLRRFLEK